MGFNYNYMDFAGYETCEKLLCKPGEGFRNTNTIRKQGITKINMNMKSPSERLGFGCFPCKYTCDILSEYLVSRILQAYS